MLTKLLLLPVIIVLALGIGVVLNVALRRKRIQWLPEKRPWFCILPKYCMNLDLTGPKEDWQDEVHQRITSVGFQLADENDEFHTYERGHDYADFSADAVRIAIVVRHPITNPAVIGLQYASEFGVAFDTGDLWQVADSIRTALISSSKLRSFPPTTDDGTKSRRDSTRTWLIPLFATGCLAVIGLGVVFVWKAASGNRIHAQGNLQPIAQQALHAPADASIENVFVESGEFVDQGTPLLGLRNKDHESRQAELLREIEEQQRSLSAVQTQLLSSRRLSDDQRIRLTKEMWEYKSSIEATQNELASGKERIEDLTVRSPMRGKIIAQADGLLPGRPVTRGDYLLTVVDPNGPWGFKLQLDEAEAGTLVRAQVSAAEPLAVDYQLASDSRWGRGVVTDVSHATAPGVLVNVEIDAAHIPPELLIPGTTVKAVILLSPN